MAGSTQMHQMLCGDLNVHFSLLLVLAGLCAHGKYAHKLLNDLFTNYTSALRPVEDTNTILNVTLQVTLSQIIDMVIINNPTSQMRDYDSFLSCIFLG